MSSRPKAPVPCLCLQGSHLSKICSDVDYEALQLRFRPQDSDYTESTECHILLTFSLSSHLVLDLMAVKELFNMQAFLDTQLGLPLEDMI